MAKTALELSPEEWKRYTPVTRKITPEVKARWDKAWVLIPKLSTLLRESFGATKIKVFGSATQLDYFSLSSDIDLAAWDIPINKYFLAALTAHEFDSGFKVDLVDPRLCRQKLLEKIETEGIEV